jgi:hypothetical protein
LIADWLGRLEQGGFSVNPLMASPAPQLNPRGGGPN